MTDEQLVVEGQKCFDYHKNVNCQCANCDNLRIIRNDGRFFARFFCVKVPKAEQRKHTDPNVHDCPFFAKGKLQAGDVTDVIL